MNSMEVKKNVKYSVCSCGLSKRLPYCDNAHREFNKNNNTNYKSIKIISSNNVKIKISCSNWLDNNE